jgi:predicted peroxiredoxin
MKQLDLWQSVGLEAFILRPFFHISPILFIVFCFSSAKNFFLTNRGISFRVWEIFKNAINSPNFYLLSETLKTKKDSDMKTLKSLLLITALLAFAAPTINAKEMPRDGVFIHISHGTDNPHRLLMGLNMASIMSADHDVLVYFDITAADALLKDSPDVTYAHFTSSKSQLKSLIEKGVRLMACPGCLKAAGKTPQDLADGIEVADKKAFFSFTKGRILSLDY